MIPRLFQLFDLKENRYTEQFFSSKPAAKEVRRSLNEFSEGKEQFRYIVRPGPDHHRYKDR